MTINVSAAAGPQTITAHAAPGAESVGATGFLWTTLRNLTQSGIDYLIGLLQAAGFFIPEGLDLGKYITTADAITDLGASPATWTDVSPLLRQAFSDAADAGLNVVAPRLRGMYFIDPASPILVRQGSGYDGPRTGKCQLSYTTVGGLKDKLNNPGLTFIVDCQSTNRMVPKIARQGATTIQRLQVAGVRLISQAAGIDVSAYGVAPTFASTITGDPLDMAPIIVTDHKHDSSGARLVDGVAAKAGNTVLDAHVVGVMRATYVGDPLPQEEPWAYQRDADGNVIYVNVTVDGQAVTIGKGLTASGLQTGISFTDVKLTGCTLKRPVATARSTAGGLTIDVQNIPPWWTGISQPNSGGASNYSLLKWQQANCRVVDMWHRAVGFTVNVRARSCRYGIYCQAGYNALGPAGQDTGKYNQGDFSVRGERIQTAVGMPADTYGHDLSIYVRGHFMDAYNMKGCTSSVFEILTDGAVAGAIDKAVYDAIVIGRDYSIDDKGPSASGDVFDCIQAGTASLVPTASGPNYNSTTKRFTDPGTGGPIWILRNGGFKPVGQSPFAVISYRGRILEASGRVFANTSADGHLEHNMDGLEFQNWSQAKSHHADAAILNASATTVLTHANARTGASGNSKRVYDIANLQNFVTGNMRHFGQTIPVDGSGVPTGVFPTEIGGNIADQFWWFKNIQAFDSGLALGDDDGDESDG